MIINHDYPIIFLQHGNLYVFFILVDLKIQGTIGESCTPKCAFANLLRHVGKGKKL